MEHLSKVGKRQPSFLIMLEHIMKKQSPTIVETGTMRTADNYEGDGMSSLLWHRALKVLGRGTLDSVDVDVEASKFAYRLCNGREPHISEDTYKKRFVLMSQPKPSFFHCSDSITWLEDQRFYGAYNNNPIDLLYLDSWDMEFPDPTPSFKHIFTEFMLARPLLAPDALICVDDNIKVVRDNNPEEIYVSKGEYIKQFMESIGNKPIYEGYQIIWSNNSKSNW